jgi:hypothetical protein
VSASLGLSQVYVQRRAETQTARRTSRQALNSTLPVIGIIPITITIQAMVPFVVIGFAETLVC